MRRTDAVLALALPALLVSCAGGSASPPPDPLESRLEAHVRELASDRYAGRAPGTPGGEAAVRYIETRLRAAGLEPAGSDGYRQPVPLRGIRTARGTALAWRPEPAGDEASGGRDASAAGDPAPGSPPAAREGPVRAAAEDFLAGWNAPVESADVEGGLVFVGYGISSPAAGWDDFGEADLRGRWAVALEGLPPGETRLPAAGAQPVSKLYAATRRGAVGLVLLSHVADWPEPHDLAREERILPGWGRGQRGQPAPWVAVKGPLVAAISGGGNPWEEAVRPGFAARPLPGRLVLNLRQDLRRFESANVLARLPGSDPALAAEHVCLSAHWDGLGRSERAVYRGVIDNAVSVGELLEAAALARLQGPSRRSLLFFFPTAEEAALVGSEYFVEHPTVALDSIVACLNKDGSPEAWGRSLDVVAVAASAAPAFETALRGAVEAQGLAWSPNPFPSEGFFFRSDHYSFLRAGVPGTLLFPGLAFEGREPAWGLEQAALYLKEHYHRSSDDLSRVLGWEGAARYVRFWLETARALADGPALPKGSVDLAGRE
jgi:hypothetical protein